MPLVEPPATAVVGYSFTATHKESGRTETGEIFCDGRFTCTDYWLAGHGHQGDLGCYALDKLYQQENKNPTFLPHDRKWVSKALWTETWFAQMCVHQPGIALDTSSLVPQQVCPPPVKNTGGRSSKKRWELLPHHTTLSFTLSLFYFIAPLPSYSVTLTLSLLLFHSLIF